MAHFISGHRPSTRVTLLTALGLFLFGCVLALLEWRLPIIDPFGHHINYTRLAPLVILVVLIPAILPLRHRLHPWPFWFYMVPLELAAGLLGYILLFYIVPRSDSVGSAVGVWGSWWFMVLCFVAIWLLSVGVAAICINVIHLFGKPRLEPRCGHCGYLLLGLRDDRCPECGSSILLAELRQQTQGT